MIAEEDFSMSSPMPPQGQPAAPKKTSIWVWIFGGIAIFLFAITLTCGVIGYMGMKMIKSAGFDSELMQKNPGLAMAKMVTAMNPDYETVKSNDREGTITVREKSTGKIISFRFDPETKKMVIIGDDGKQSTVSMTGNGATGGVDITTSDGTVKFGSSAGNSAPSWVPLYPGSTPNGTFSSSTGDGSTNTFTFKSKDASSKVLSYYSDQLKAAGFTINMTTTTDAGGLVQATDDSKKRTVMVTVQNNADGTEASVTAVEKK
jgi:hypothetical protein